MDKPLVFVDASVLLESVLANRNHASEAQEYISKVRAVVSPLSAHLLMYFGKKDNIPFIYLKEWLLYYAYSEIGPSEMAWAFENCNDTDFEDALQVASAISYGCEKIVTLDKGLSKQYGSFIKIEVLK